MKLSDWLTVIGIIIGTLMSLVSIETARRIFKEQEKGQQAGTDLLGGLLGKLIELMRVVIDKLTKLVPRQPEPRETPKPDPTLPLPPGEPRPHTKPKNEDEQRPHGESRTVDQVTASKISHPVPGRANLAGPRTPSRAPKKPVFIHILPPRDSLDRSTDRSVDGPGKRLNPHTRNSR